MKKEELKYLQRLAELYPTIAQTATEIINLQSILNLPKGKEHFLTDLHGEYEAFSHVLRNGSGAIRRKIDDVFGHTLSTADKRGIATLIYYPREKIEQVKKEEEDMENWYKITLYRLIEICKTVASKYTRSKVRKSLPSQFAYVIEELITEKEEIHDKEVRLISATGEQLGILSLADAMGKANEAELDLVKISPNAVPPVCKLMDYGKYRFEQTKRDKEAKKNQRIVEIKEVRMSPGIDSNDLNVKIRNAQRFLADGNRVKVAVRFRGREMAHTDIGKRLLEKFAEACTEVATVDKEPKLEGRHMTMFLSCKQVKETKGKNKESKEAKPATQTEE